MKGISSGGREPRWQDLVAGFGLIAVFWSQFAWVKATNFGGWDEWLFLWLGERGILASPYSNRPLNFLWTIPGAQLTPHSFVGFYVLHTTYLCASGLLVLLLCRRLIPERPLVGLLAATFSLIWAPHDLTRLSTMQMTVNSGFSFGALLTLFLLVEAWQRRHRGLFIIAALWGLAMIRGYEGVAPLVIAAPPLLLLRESRADPARARRWLGMWAVFALLAGAAALLPLLGSAEHARYQISGLGLDLHPWRVLGRLGTQFALHTQPLLATPLGWWKVPAVALSVVVFGLLFAVASRRRREPEGRRDLAALVLVGALLAAMGYAPFVVTESIVDAHRTQFLAMPGIGLLLASGIGLVASCAPESLRRATMGFLGAWVVAQGAAHTIAMQKHWNEASYYQRQINLLEQLTTMAPRLEPHTLVAVVGDTSAFPSGFGFRHAVEYLYPGEATGIVVGDSELVLYTTRGTLQGIETEPLPVLRESWGVEPTRHRHDEVLVLRSDASQRLSMVKLWPTRVFGRLPEGASYDPEARIVEGAPEPPEREILTPLSIGLPVDGG